MRVAVIALLGACSLTPGLPAHAQEASSNAESKSFNITANFQVQTSVAPDATTDDMIKAVAQAEASLSEVVNRECEVLEKAFKGQCTLVQLNMNSNVNGRRRFMNGDFGNEFGGGRLVSAGMNATFAISRGAEPKPNPTPQ